MTETYKGFRITATYTGSKKAPWDSPENWNHNRVTVTNAETGKHTDFDFWTSIAKPQMKTRYDVLNAFCAFVNDAISGEMAFVDFCCEFGYDDDSIAALHVWKACKRATAKLHRIYDGDIYDLANELQEIAG